MKKTKFLSSLLMGGLAIGMIAIGVIAIAGTASAQTYLYSNEGGYWGEACFPTCYWWYHADEGYCGKYGECLPEYMQWTYNTDEWYGYDSQRGYWSNTYPSDEFRYWNDGYAYAFIPSVDSTTQHAAYFTQSDEDPFEEVCDGSLFDEWRVIVNQLGISDSWTNITYDNDPVYCLMAVRLGDATYEDDLTYRVGFDEIKVEY